MANLFVESLVFLIRYLRFWSRPQSRGIIDLLELRYRRLGRCFFRVRIRVRLRIILVGFRYWRHFTHHHDGEGNVIGVFLDDTFQTMVAGKFTTVVLEMQDNLRAPLVLVYFGQSVSARGIGFPTCCVRRRIARLTRFQHNAISDNKGRIETDAKLANHTGVCFLITRE